MPSVEKSRPDASKKMSKKFSKTDSTRSKNTQSKKLPVKASAAAKPANGVKRTRDAEKSAAAVKVVKTGDKTKKKKVEEPVPVSDSGSGSVSDSESDSEDSDRDEESQEEEKAEDIHNGIEAKSKKVSEVVKNAERVEASEESESDEDEDGEMLHGLSDLSDADSSDEDEAGSIGEISKSGVVRLPSSRDDVAVKTRLDNVHKKRKEGGKTSTPIVLYFGRVPRSMPEEPLRAYLTQFGDISRLRLSRNKKTGASKHYAFVEFKDEEVGIIVQETMNNYLLEGRLLQVRVIPKDKVHPGLWVGADRKWRKMPEARRFRVKHDDAKTTEEQKAIQKKLLKRQEQRREKIKSQGIDYEFEGYT